MVGSLAGGMGAVIAEDFIMLFLGIELISFCTYPLVAANTQSYFSTEAGFKYFITNSLSSAVFLLGASIVYVQTGSVDYYDINDFMIFSQVLREKVNLTGVFLIYGAMFAKLGVAPFHI